MRKEDTLALLRQGESCVVSDITACDGIRRRLQDIGLIKGTNITCVQKSPLGDPTAYLIRGAVIALRSDDSLCVRIVK